MREIVFRGKRFNCKWVEGGIFIQEEDEVKDFAVYIVTPSLAAKCNMYEVHPETVGQYTGLKDNNGKRIFEGDIVKCSHGFITANAEEAEIRNPRKSYGKEIEKMTLGGFRCRYWRNYAVSFHDGGIRVQNGSDTHYLQQSYIRNHEIEVIGNIHDNPELLEVR